MVVKTDDEIHALSIMKVYDNFSFIFSALPKKIELLKMSKVLQLFENPYHHGKSVDKKRIIFFRQSLRHLVVFHKIKYQVFRSSFDIHCNRVIGCIVICHRYWPRNTTNTTADICDNQVHNYLRLFDVLANCPFITTETMCDYYL